MSYTLSINALQVLDCSPLSSVVVTVNWNYTLHDDGNVETINQTMELSNPDPNSFIPYDQLTQDTVKGWIVSGVDLLVLEQTLQSNLAARLAKPTQKPLPW